MEKQYADRVRLLKETNQKLVETSKAGADGSGAGGPKVNAGAEQLLSEQLREMTAVLEEFDVKYTRKEKQLEVARDQNKQLKAAFDKIRSLQ